MFLILVLRYVIKSKEKCYFLSCNDVIYDDISVMNFLVKLCHKREYLHFVQVIYDKFVLDCLYTANQENVRVVSKYEP